MKTFNFLKKPWLWVLVLLVVIFIVWQVNQEDELDISTETIAARNIEEVITGTGHVKAQDDLEVSFELSGTLEEVLVEEGDEVEAGEPLARLDRELAREELEQARFELSAQDAQLREMMAGVTEEDAQRAREQVKTASTSLANARESLQDTQETHETRVKNAQEDLLTTGLQTKLASEEQRTRYSYQPPEITGSYTGKDSGEYRITLFSSQTDSGYSFRYQSNLEEGGTGRVSTRTSQPLGNKGLEIRFPENFARHRGLEWVVKIPNTDHPEYTKLRQAYESAQESRDKAVREAERRIREAEQNLQAAQAEYRAAVADVRGEKIETQQAAVERAEIAIRSAQTKLNKHTLYSPLDGEVYLKHLSRGETVSPGTPVFSLSGGDQPHLEIFIPEVDITNLELGDPAIARFDAFPDERFEAKTTRISGTAVDRQGVASFKTRLDLQDPDPRIRTGMTADLDITTAERSDVAAIPGRALIRKEDGFFVRAMKDNTYEYRPVSRGLRGSDGWIEITSGLEEGDEIIVYADDQALQQLKEKNDD